ncbi:cytochrome c biogenesis protein CcsA [Flavobacterium lindanitolerans]|uniref:cytochrome c biogenesis protein CcsA n=1 Tax=Flavobacterium lindanitolerans TaxID=428988 RepID=UPI0028087C9A|nr:cytochrome c biogenesis protein CcsA [Flavobacterium lindanitolerans]MDQ7960299.1 cytochrome c biogenesis protein CcsA [Flavobacterium lindanitolerans]
MDKIFSFLFSTRLMAVLFIVFAAAMGIGTFIEDAYNTDVARILIYNSWWFEAIMFLFLINFIGNIKKYQLHKKEKWATLLLHLSFIFILIGAFVTRHISYEGMMSIAEGASENQVYSEKTFLNVFVDGEYKGEMKRRVEEKELLLSQVTDNDFSIKGKFAETPYEIEYKDFIMNAKEVIKEDPNGTLYIKMVESGDGSRHEHYLKEGEVQSIHNVLFAFNKPTNGAVNVIKEGDKYTFKAPFGGQFMRMADKFQGTVVKDSVQDLMFRSLYNVGGAQFVFPEAAIKGKVAYESNNDYKDKATDDALIVTIKAGGKTQDVTLIGSKGKMGEPQSFKVGGLDFTLFYGSKVYTLPFKIKLNDFIAEKYPGTLKSFSAFRSKITVEDEKPFDYEIFMNNVLDHGGYRFFQASYDYTDNHLRDTYEPNITVLSANHDFWGTWITYIGYFLLYIGMMAILFDKNSRFGIVKKKLDKIKSRKAKLITVLLLFVSVGSFAQHDHNAPGHNHGTGSAAPLKRVMPTEKQIDSLLKIIEVKPEHAAKFGRIVIQDDGGRMKPINTFSSELLRKVSKSDHYKGYNSDQVFLSMSQYPEVWFNVPFVYLKKDNDSLHKILGVDLKAKHVPFISFFDEQGNYKLSPYLDEAYKAAIPNQFQKDFIDVDKKVVLLNAALSGKILKIFPIPYNKANKWVSYLELNETGIKGVDSTYTKNVLPAYMGFLNEARKSGGYKQADEILESITLFQKKYGKAVRPSDDKINSEILYNKYDIFKKLYYLYMMAGVFMLLFTIVKIFNSRKAIRVIVKAFHILIGFFFILHTAGLIMRWYISGHAPWSDAYESMIYVGWATMFFGLAFGRKSELTVASTAFVASMILMIAHWNWMDPAIANLQPVLNSYWLMIHVAVIVASYGPFTLGMILGLVSLLLMIFANEKNSKKLELNIKEITYITELSLTVGLVMLTIGNFLGGQWANESWGRYWGWDPKETWALISIMVYAFVIHARLVPGLKGTWIFNVFSVFAFYSIMMTYFGVNFYLTGLHSYASGDKVVTPNFVFVSIGIVTLISILAYFKQKKYLRS